MITQILLSQVSAEILSVYLCRVVELLHQRCCCQRCKQKADYRAELSRLAASLSIQRYHSTEEQREVLAWHALVYEIISVTISPCSQAPPQTI